MRALVNAVPVPEFDSTPFTMPPPLREATVAIVTTAALRRPEDPPWARGDESFRVLPDTARNLTVGHASPNWDRGGVAAYLNVAYPVDRLRGLADARAIGAVQPYHLSFHGGIERAQCTSLLDCA